MVSFLLPLAEYESDEEGEEDGKANEEEDGGKEKEGEEQNPTESEGKNKRKREHEKGEEQEDNIESEEATVEYILKLQRTVGMMLDKNNTSDSNITVRIKSVPRTHFFFSAVSRRSWKSRYFCTSRASTSPSNATFVRALFIYSVTTATIRHEESNYDE